MNEHASNTAGFRHDVLSGLGDRLDHAVQDATVRMQALQASVVQQTRRAEAAEHRAADLEQHLAVAEAKLAVEAMHAAGLAAQASHLMAIAADAAIPALAELLAEQNLDGGAKSRLTQVYDQAFDTKAAELGIEDPARFRAA